MLALTSWVAPAAADSPHHRSAPPAAGVLARALAATTPVTGGTLIETVPTLVADTSSGLGTYERGPTEEIDLHLLGVHPVPSTDVNAVVLDVTVTGARAGGLGVFGASSNIQTPVSYRADDPTSETVVEPLGLDGSISFGATTPVSLTAVVTGYVTGTAGRPPTPGAGGLAPMVSATLFDTRDGANVAKGQVAAGHSVTVSVAGHAQVPAGAGAVLMELTAFEGSTAGTVTAYASGTPRPATVSVAGTANETIGNAVLVPLSAAGSVTIYTSSAANLSAVVEGWVRTPYGADSGQQVVSLPAARLLDTRTGGGDPLAAGTPTTVQITGRGGVPASHVSSVLLDIQGIDPAAADTISAYATGQPATPEPALDVPAEGDRAALTLVPVSADGSVTLLSSASSNASVDVEGYLSGTPDFTPPAPVTDLRETSGGISSFVLAWTNPTDPDYTGTVVRGAVYNGSPSASQDLTPASGFAATGTTAPASAVPEAWSSAGGADIYSVFTEDEHGNTSAARVVTVAPPSAATGSISGRVVDSAGAPIADVAVGPPQGEETITDANGTYAIGDLTPGFYPLCFSPPPATVGLGSLSRCFDDRDPATAPDPIKVSAAAVTTGIDQQLPVAAAVSGTVTDTSGQPLVGIAVDVEREPTGADAEQATTYTAADGSYSLGGFETGTYQVCFSDQPDGTGSTTGYARSCYRNEAADGSADPVSLTEGSDTSGIDGTLRPLGGISGTVSTADGRSPAEASVSLFPAGSGYPAAQTAYVGPDGSYQFTDLTTGGYDVCFQPYDDAPVGPPAQAPYPLVGQCWGGIGPESGPAAGVAVTEGASTSGIDADLQVAGAITGRVVDTNGDAVPDAEVAVTTSTGEYVSVTDSSDDGSYAIDVAPGSYDVCFEDVRDGNTSCHGQTPAGGGPPSAVVVNSGQATGGADGALPVYMADTGTISGVVTDAAGHPIRGIRLELSGDAESGGTTAADGSYSFTVRAGTYFVCFSDGGLSDEQTSGAPTTGYVGQCWDAVAGSGQPTAIQIGTGQNVTGIDAALAAAASISGVVTDAAGDPVAGVKVSADNVTTTTDSAGSYLLLDQQGPTDGVCADPAGVSSADGYGYAPGCYGDGSGEDGGSGVPVDPGQAVTGIDVTLLEWGAISGTVTSPTGTPVAGAIVTVDSDGAKETATAADGTYTIGHVAQGSEHQVCFTVPDSAPGPGYVAQCYEDQPYETFPQSGPVGVSAGQTTGGIDAQLTPDGTVEGTLTDPSGAPLEDAGVNVIASYDDPSDPSAPVMPEFGDPHVQTDSGGHFEVTHLEPGQYSVCFTAGPGPARYGYVSQCYDNPAETVSGPTVTVSPGTTVDTSTALSEAGAIAGTVTDVGGAPVAGEDVTVRAMDGTNGGFVPTQTTDSDGNYEIDELVPGTYSVCFTPDQYAPREPEVCYATGSDEADATPVTVSSAAVTPGIDQQLPYAASGS